MPFQIKTRYKYSTQTISVGFGFESPLIQTRHPSPSPFWTQFCFEVWFIISPRLPPSDVPPKDIPLIGTMSPVRIDRRVVFSRISGIVEVEDKKICWILTMSNDDVCIKIYTCLGDLILCNITGRVVNGARSRNVSYTSNLWLNMFEGCSYRPPSSNLGLGIGAAK